MPTVSTPVTRRAVNIDPYMDAARLSSDVVVMFNKVLAAVFYPALRQTELQSAGPDGIRQEHPHLHGALKCARIYSGLRSCGPTCLAITLNQPQQPIGSPTSCSSFRCYAGFTLT